MAATSLIEWTDATWPIVQGCDPVSQGCVGCYAVPLLWRMMHNPNPKISGPLQGIVEKHINADGKAILRFTGAIAERNDRLTWPFQWRQPRKIFVPSHGDLFHKKVSRDFIDKVFAVMALTPQHTYQVLTKRSKRMRDYCADPTVARRIGEAIVCGMWPDTVDQNSCIDWEAPAEPAELKTWPLPNVWLGISAEDQPNLEERWPHLEATPAAKRFLSYEPALGPIQPWHIQGHDGRYIDALAGEHWFPGAGSINSQTRSGKPKLDWIIAGGESGPNARPPLPRWFTELRDICRERGTAFFFKQWGEWIEPVQHLPAEHREAVGSAIASGRWTDRTLLKDCTAMVRVGSDRTGALLNGREHREFPQ